MPTDARVDAYVAAAAAFAQPILTHLRASVHAADARVSETIKWGMPFFMLGQRPLASMAAFKAHCAFGFWQAGVLPKTEQKEGAMGQYGRITSLAELPSRTALKSQIKHAVQLIDAGATPAPRARRPARPPEVPGFLHEALREHAAARRVFESLPPSHQREYVDWLQEAKRPETRERRLAQTVQWLAEGKSRNWKYAAC